MKILLDERVKFGEFKNAKTFFWTDALFLQTRLVKSFNHIYYLSYLRAFMFYHRWMRMLEVDFASTIFRLTDKMENVEDTDVYTDEFEQAKKDGYDIISINNEAQMLPFYTGELKVRPCMSIHYAYTNLWVDKSAIIENKLVNYDPVAYNQAVAYHNVLQKLSVLSENSHSDKNIGFDYCNDCALEAYIWTLYKKKFGSKLTVSEHVTRLSKLYHGNLLDNIHGHMFPKTKEVDIKLFIKTVVESHVPEEFHSLLRSVSAPRLPKLLINMKTDPKLAFYKMPVTEYNKFVNIPDRKHIVSGLAHLISGFYKWNPLSQAVVVYAGSANNRTLWQITQLIENAKFICFDPKLADIFIGAHGKNHWNEYDNPANNIVYMSINTSNTPDEFDIRPVTYFDGQYQVGLLNKNSEENDGVLTSITNLSESQYEKYGEYIAMSTKRIFVFEEELTPASAKVLEAILSNESTKNTDSNRGYNRVYPEDYTLNQDATLWVDGLSASVTMEIAKILKPGWLRHICGTDTRLDVDKYFDYEVHLMPWSDRNGIEYELYSFPRIAKLTPIDQTHIRDYIFYHNMVDRVSFHINTLADSDIGFDCCGDCALESRITNDIKNVFSNQSRKNMTTPMQDSRSLFKLISDISGIVTLKQSGHGRLFGAT